MQHYLNGFLVAAVFIVLTHGAGFAADEAIAIPIEPPAYRLVDLNRRYGIDYGQTYAVNRCGAVAGSHLAAGGEEHAYVGDDAALHDLGTLGGHYSVAYGLNAAGLAVGCSLTGEVDDYGWITEAFVADGTGMTGLELGSSCAHAVSDTGWITGAMQTATGAYHAFLRNAAGQTMDLGTLDGRESFGYAVNAAGTVAGMADSVVFATGEHAVHAFVYDASGMRDLGSLGYACWNEPYGGELRCDEYSAATAINDGGEVAGYSTTDDGATRAFVAVEGDLRDLGTLGGTQSWALGINNSSQVVGTALIEDDAAYHGFLFEQGRLYDLNQLIVAPPLPPTIRAAQAINSFGQIAADGYRLDPVYRSVTPGRDGAIDVVLGRTLAFEVWIAGGAGGTPQPGKGTQLQALIELVDPPPAEGQDKALAMAARKAARWQAVGPMVWGGTDSREWLAAEFGIPTELQGRSAVIRLRLRTVGRDWNPTVYLRRLTMN